MTTLIKIIALYSFILLSLNLNPAFAQSIDDTISSNRHNNEDTIIVSGLTTFMSGTLIGLATIDLYPSYDSAQKNNSIVEHRIWAWLSIFSAVSSELILFLNINNISNTNDLIWLINLTGLNTLFAALDVYILYKN